MILPRNGGLIRFGRKGWAVLQGEKLAVVAQGPWVGRDGFVAETAVQLDRVNASIARLERELEKSREALAALQEEANRTRRLEAFEETLKNSRDNKITELQRSCRDLKARLDTIEGDRSTFAGLTYKSFAAVDQKLAELVSLQERIDRSERKARRYAMLGAVAAAAAVAGFAVHFI
jgi:septal ring factor EnvC (AmiA/AmiB activator)